MTISEVIEYCRNRQYMSGVDRDKNRIKSTQEVFTPTKEVIDLVNSYTESEYKDFDQTFLDPSCGDGQFLSEILIRKMENGSTFEQALSTIYGVDLMIDNVDLCRERLLCGREDLRHIVEQNIVCYNGLEYDFEFARRNNIEVKHEKAERKKAEAARKKAEKEKIKLEKLKKDAREIIWNSLVYRTGKVPTDNMIDKELKKMFPDLKG